MRTQLLCLLTVFLCTCVRAQSTDAGETGVSSTIVAATVFREGAQVGRQGTATIGSGRTTLVFTGLTDALDPGSVQVATKADVLILSVAHRLNFYSLPERSAVETGLYDRIEALGRDRRRLQTEVAIAKEEEEVLRANRNLGGSASGLNAEDLERGVTFQRERIREIKLAYLVLDDSLRANQERRGLLQQQLVELGQQRQQPTTSEVVVVVESKQAVNAAFTISYLVGSAGWTPEYDVRVTDISRPVDLRYRAQVSQESGEDWANVDLTLSTGDPTVSATAPVLRTWRIQPGQLPPVYGPVVKHQTGSQVSRIQGIVTDADEQPLIGATVRVTGKSVSTVTDLDGHYALDLPDGSQTITVSYTGYEMKVVDIYGPQLDVVLEEGARLDEVVVTGYARQGLAGRLAGALGGIGRNESSKLQQETSPPPVPTRTLRRATTLAFAIELPYTIPSDGKPRRVEIKQYDVPATYRHLAVPKVSSDVFLSATVRDWEQYDLISGDLQVFFEGTYLGSAFLDVDQTADSLQLSLGRDAGVVVTRKLDAEFKKYNGLLSGKQTENRAWVISVRNTKSQPVSLTVLDQVPISGQSNIDVDLELPDAAILDEATGEVRWQLRLLPGNERTLRFNYRVRYPTGEAVYVE